MKNKITKYDIHELVKIVKEPSETYSQYVPPFIRPIIKIIIIILAIIILFILSPVLVPLAFFNRRKDPFSKLYQDLEIKWNNESSVIALNSLRKIYRQLTENFDKLKKMRSVRIDPYGKFRWPEYFQVVESLYLWEMQHNNFNKANEICENLLNRILKNKSNIDSTIERWIVYKAKVINKIDVNKNAEKYLMEYIDPQKKESPIKEYLYELRKSKER